MDIERKVKEKMNPANDKESGNFNRLKELISKLKPEELKIAQAYISSFDPRGKNNKAVQIFTTIFKNAGIEERSMRRKFGSAGETGFDALISILKDKIEYSLTLEVNTQRPGQYSEKWQAQLDVRERINIYDILYGKGLYDEAFGVLKKVIEKCKKYELYFELVSALMKKMEFLKLRVPSKDLILSKDFLEINRQIQFYIDCLQALIVANNWYYIHIGYGELEGKGGKIFDEYKKGIAVLEKEFKHTGSATVAHFMYILKTTYYDGLGKYEEAEFVANEWLELVTHNKAVSMPIRIGAALTYLANVQMNRKKFSECLFTLNKAKQQFKPGTSNYQIIDDLEVYSFFYLGKYKEAEDHLLLVMDQRPYRQFLFKENRRKYLYACTLLVQERYKESLDVLEKIEELKDDRAGFYVGIKTLIVIAAYYKGDYEYTFYKLESLRKLLDSLRKTGEVRQRDVLIYNILSEWLKSKGNFKITMQNRQDNFTLLESSNPEYAWNINSHEIILFHEWFKLKAECKPYHIDLSDYKPSVKKKVKAENKVLEVS